MEEDVWKPGSFTKNFSWGTGVGLAELHHVIRVGFAEELKDVLRKDFRARIAPTGRPDYIPMNFFLFNRMEGDHDFICTDELVFQALGWDHGPAFDNLGLFAFLLSFAGRWRRSKPGQRRPAMWANAYVLDRLATAYNWDDTRVTANDIQHFVTGDRRYKAQTSRKLATNLNHLLHIGNIRKFAEKRVSRWWVDALFLILDRLIADALIDGVDLKEADYEKSIFDSDFFHLTGGVTEEKRLAIRHLVRLYVAVGGKKRFSEGAVAERTVALTGQASEKRFNDARPRGAVHETNIRIVKSIPPACADLAEHAGFMVVPPDDMAEFYSDDFVDFRETAALAVLNKHRLRSTASPEDLLRSTRYA